MARWCASSAPIYISQTVDMVACAARQRAIYSAILPARQHIYIIRLRMRKMQIIIDGAPNVPNTVENRLAQYSLPFHTNLPIRADDFQNLKLISFSQ